MKLIDFDVLKKMVEQRFDMQDLYLPIHFLEIAEELAEKGLWTTFKKRELTPLEKRLKPDWCYILENAPGYDDIEILVTDGKTVWADYFVENGNECYLDSGREIENGMAWMYMPEPYKGESQCKS